MNVTDELIKTLSDPKPLYALAGAGDLAAEKLRDAPALLTEVAGTVTTLANRIAAEAPERIAKVQAKLAEVPGGLDPRTVAAGLDPRAARETLREAVGKADAQVLRDKAQTIALVQVGRVLEAAGKAVETYEGLAERGKTVVERYRGAGEPAAEVTVVVEQVLVDDAETPAPAPAAAPVVEDAVVQEPAAKAAPQPEPAPAAPKTAKKTAAPRKRAAAKSTAAKA
jgi:heparin binding hemagglutinin HbhA